MNPDDYLHLTRLAALEAALLALFREQEVALAIDRLVVTFDEGGMQVEYCKGQTPVSGEAL